MSTLSGVKEESGYLSPGQDLHKGYDYNSPATEPHGGAVECRCIEHVPALEKSARLLLIVLLLGLSVLAGQCLPAYAAARDGLSCNPWSLIPSPKSGTNSNELDGVAVVSGGDIWAVGSYFSSTLNSSQTLAEHWNGSKWQVVPSTNVGTGFNSLASVAADLSGSVWAVGDSTNPAQSNDQTLVEHWNGSKWQVVSSPNVGASDNDLSGVAADLSGGLWAVGGYFNTASNHEQTLIERWHGGSWQVTSSPNVGASDNDLSGVAVEISGNAWAVGSYFDPRFGSFRTLIERWNGSRWSMIPSPNIGISDNQLTAVTVDFSGNAWAVGEYFNRILGSFQTLIEHWDGSSWQLVPSLNVGSGDNRLNDVTVDFSGNAWAVGNYTDPNNLFETLVEHWNGIGWQVVPSANPRAGNSLLLGVDAGGIFSPARVISRVWAVGYSGTQTLTEASPNQVACS
jgi:hypothetical protein